MYDWRRGGAGEARTSTSIIAQVKVVEWCCGRDFGCVTFISAALGGRCKNSTQDDIIEGIAPMWP